MSQNILFGTIQYVGMSVRKVITLFLGVVFFALCDVAVAQVRTDSLTVYFQQNKTDYNKDYQDNEASVTQFLERVSSVPDSSSRRSFLCVDIYASASPDGSQLLNKSVVEKRFDAVYGYFQHKLHFADSSAVITKVCENWDGLREIVETLDLDWRDEALSIIDNESDADKRELRLRYLRKGEPWKYRCDNAFPKLRKFEVKVRYLLPLPKLPRIVPPPLSSASCVVAKTDTLAAEKEEMQPQWTRQMTVKVNAVGIAFGNANVALEVDLAPHWSLSVPFYYSGGVDYFKETIKFRGIVLQPEVRYYIKENNGFYVGAHLGIGWYNYALNKEWRIQDHNGNRPSWGGGLGLGYALQFKKHPAWGMEFAVGAGVYDSKYDIFYNEANGPYHKRGVHKTWIGVDNASVAFTYKFGLKRKGGQRR